jgi:hypothetical protein
MPFEGNGTFNQISIKVTLQLNRDPSFGSFKMEVASRSTSQLDNMEEHNLTNSFELWSFSLSYVFCVIT